MQTFTATSSGGELEFTDTKRLHNFLLMNTGPLVVNIGKERRTRSNKQNRYFYGQVMQMLSEHTGHSVEELKQALKKEFGWTKVITLNGKQVEILRSSADLSTAEFEKFMTQIRMVGDQLGCYIAEPNSSHFSLTE